jgi:lipoyl(octanoyl) transferase
VSKWIAYHGFAININNNLSNYENIIPCGITDKDIINLKEITNQDYKKLGQMVIEKFSKNLEE